jgi:heme/copper-type cytochrome/quinol oxidase subunit 3
MDRLAAPMGAPFNRILWSVQAGVVLATAGAGLWLAKNGVIDEAAQAMQVIAILTMALGLGFVLSALASYGLSRQLGLVNSPANHA